MLSADCFLNYNRLMAINIPRLRRWFAAAAIALILLVAGFYFYARMRVRRTLEDVPKRLGVNIQQSTEGFSLSKSEGGRTIFTIRAAKAVQYKQGGRAELRDVSIVVYGRTSNRFDQIYGASFEYDPQTGNVMARGEVHIDLEGDASGPVRPDQVPPQELKNPIHLKTSGLVFNQKTGNANTDERIEFRFPQAQGTAVGASYDARASIFTLKSDVNVLTGGPHPEHITARRAMVTKEPRQAIMEGVRVERAEKGSGRTQRLQADRVIANLRDDNSIAHVIAKEDVTAHAAGSSTMDVRAAQADLYLSDNNLLRSAVLSGGVDMAGTGDRTMQGHASRVTVDFAEGRAQKIHAVEDVKMVQQPSPRGPGSQQLELAADALDFFITGGRQLSRAETSGAAQVVVGSAGSARNLITAGKFEAAFNRGRISAVHGAPNARVLSSAPGQPEKNTTSQQLTMTFAKAGGLESIVQQGDFHYAETGASGRQAWAEQARYSAADDMLVLTGSPRVVEGGMTATAQTLRLNRRTNDALAEGNVKTTYSQLKPQPGGAMLATSEPVHVTGKSAIFQSSTGVARYSGGARLWQGSNIVQAPTIEFDRTNRTVSAQSQAGIPVSTVFVQQDKAGKVTPVNITATRLNYSDSERKAVFRGGVLLKGAEATVTADQVEVFLLTQGQAAAGPSQLERVVAQKHVVIQEPARRATGDRLVYSAAEGKFVLTGGPPSIFDAERGTVTGDSLTFYSRDDRVLVEGGSSRTLTQTRVKK
jgi:lipopolysaccharide export system protein LptA